MTNEQNTSEECDEAVLISLGEKLADLDLTDPERVALADLLSGDDVVGFGRFGRVDLINGIRAGIRVPKMGPSTFGVRDGNEDLGTFGVRASNIKDAKPGRF